MNKNKVNNLVEKWVIDLNIYFIEGFFIIEKVKVFKFYFKYYI